VVSLACQLWPSCCLQASQNEIREALESNDEDAKVAAMQKAITAILAGEQFPALFITIVRYVLPSENHMVQKLLLLYLVSGQGGTRARAARKRQQCQRPAPSTSALPVC
jgi:hypothetical protein